MIDNLAARIWNFDRLFAFQFPISGNLKMSDRQVLQQVLRQFAMGSSLGSIFIAALFVSSTSVFDAVLNSNSPTTTLLILVFGVLSYFGFGAAITGFVFIVMDGDPRKNH